MACTWDMPMGRQERPASLEPKRLWKSAWQFAKSQFCEFMDFDGFSWILMDVPEFLGFGYIWIYLDSASDGKMDGVFFRSQDLNPHCWPTTKRGGPPANWVPPPPAGPTSGSWANCWNLNNLRPLGAQHSKAAPRTPLFLVHVSHWTSLNRQGLSKNKCRKFQQKPWQFVPQISPVSSLLANPKPSLVPTWIFPQVTRRSEMFPCWTMDHWKQTGKYYGGDTPTSFSNISTSRTRYDNMPVPI